MKSNSEEKTTCNLVITDCQIKMRNLFIAIAEVYNLDRESLLKNMMLPYVNDVISDLSAQPDCKTEIIDALQHQINSIFHTGRKGDFLG
jgi:hypothetical protein